MNNSRQNLANLITILRILLSIAILFTKVFTVQFYVFYFMAGLTDIFDGIAARMLGTESEFGARLDTVADSIFVLVAAIKILPQLEIASFIWIWIGIIALIKFANMTREYIKQKKFLSIHTTLNKITGILLFVFPLTLSVINIRYSSTILCLVATIAALQEGQYVVNNK